ncbi:23S rRNA (adenine(2030)-N(6))-methyltransferase RlmJ [Lentilitoribacter sp. EG35]|uniref:23S rRNA (adenine(2030)-N(6))-methyltransferase RlmJ n=1 Tax=Lentilitoribacter sp. EG35 TaxID=3234192 RepID=UPI00345FC7FA
MNYRHIYHAGNFADCLKHAILSRIITYMQKKDKAFRVIDTHAGPGIYDLSSKEAQKTGEWKDGIGKLREANWSKKSKELLTPYFDAVQAVNMGEKFDTYPGSPMITHSLLRKQDRMTVSELHADDFQKLHALFKGDYQVKTQEVNGWHALKSNLPPKEKRGVLLVDPAFEEKGDFFRMVRGAREALERFSTGTMCFWYPIKQGLEMREFNADMVNVVGHPNTIVAELWVKDTAHSLDGSGMVIVNPPYTLVNELRIILPEMSRALSQTEDGGWRVSTLVPES